MGETDLEYRQSGRRKKVRKSHEKGFKAADEQKVGRPSTRLRHSRQREQGPRFRDRETGWKGFDVSSVSEL